LNCALSRALGQLNALGANRALAADGDDSISIVIGEGCTAWQRGRNVDNSTLQLIPRVSEALRLLLRYLKLFPNLA
jgi:hypothetical protein